MVAKWGGGSNQGDSRKRFSHAAGSRVPAYRIVSTANVRYSVGVFSDDIKKTGGFIVRLEVLRIVPSLS